ncbi:mucin-2 isoform X2 [Procambarus clarkii]
MTAGLLSHRVRLYEQAQGMAALISSTTTQPAMNLLRVLCVVLVASVTTWAQPQRPRQTPLAMGMRFLGNLRNGMTRTIQGIFGSGPRRGKETPSERPAISQKPQQLNFLPPVSDNHFPTATKDHFPPAPENSFSPLTESRFPPATENHLPPAVEKPSLTGTEIPSSFFTVFHESVVSTAFPDTQGFTDESFKPNNFLTGTTPFQGTIDEDQLPFIPTHSDKHPQALPLVQNQLASPPQDSSPHSFSSTGFTDFGSPKPGDTLTDTSIPFGNTATFNLGNAFKSSRSQDSFPQTIHSFHFLDSPENKEVFGQALHQADEHISPQPFARNSQPSHHPNNHNNPQQFTRSIEPSNLSEFSHTNQERTTLSEDHPTVIIRSQSPSPTHVPTQSFNEQQKRRSTTQLQSRLSTPTLIPATLEFKKQARDNQQPNKKSVVPVKINNGHINTETKIQVTPKENDDGTEGEEVSGYEFGYGVLDNDTGNQFFHAEKREEGQTRGSYKIQLPDGRVQTVTYVANSQGFHPKVTFDGEAHFPDKTSTTPA